MIESIEALLSPHDPALLDAAMLGRKRLHLRTDRAAAFARLLPWTLFNTLPSVEGLNNADLRILQKGRDVFYDMLVLPSFGRRRRRLSPENLQNIGRQGVSVVANRVQERIPAIAALNAMLERRYRCLSWTNCYASFRRDGAFQPHWDDHDILVLQLQGDKRWFFHGTWNSPEPVPDLASLPPAEAEMVLRPGDVLFVPRGDVHHAEVIGEDSLHLSVDLLHARSSDVLRWLADLADERTTVGGEDILPMEAGAAREERRSRLQAMIAGFAEELDLEAFFAARDAAREPARPLNLGLSGRVSNTTLVLPSSRNRVVPEGLSPVESGVMAHLLAHDGARVAALVAALPEQEATAIRDAVASLAHKALVFLGD